MYTWNWFSANTPKANAGKGSFEGGDTSLPLSTGAQYFALINLNLKLQHCVKAGFSLLLILLVGGWPTQTNQLATLSLAQSANIYKLPR